MGVFTSLAKSCLVSKEDNIEIVGIFSWREWLNLSNWENELANDYLCEDNTIDELMNLLINQNVSFELFIASWCNDSIIEVPIIIKILKKIGLNESQYKLIGVSQDKFKPSEAFINNIDYVPTLVIYKNNIEIGRIVESCNISWESDILQILKNN